MKDEADFNDVDDASERGPSGLLERTLRVLELLANNARGLQVFEVAERLGIPRSAAHRVLTALVQQGYVRQERNLGMYMLTAKIASLAFSFLAGSGITDLAQPILDQLARQAGELVRLALIDGRSLTWVAKAQGSPHGLRYDPEMGQIGRLSCSASGIAWLSCLPDEEAFDLVEKQGYGSREDYGPKAPQSRQALQKYLKQARRLGYSVTVATYYPWMSSLAAPIRSPLSGEVIGTVVIAGPHLRLPEERLHELAPSLLQAAQDLSQAIQATPALTRPASNQSFFAGKPA